MWLVPWEPRVPRWFVGAAREAVGTGVEALASVDEEDSGLCCFPLKLMGCWADPVVEWELNGEGWLLA